MGDGSQAEKTWIENEALVKRLLERSPTSPKYRQQLAHSYYNHGNLLSGLKKKEQAKEAYRHAQALGSELAAEFPENVGYQSELGATLNNIASILGESGELDEACGLLVKAVQHQKTAVKAEPRKALYRDYLANHYVNLVRFLLHLRDHVRAARWALELPQFLPDDLLHHCQMASDWDMCRRPGRIPNSLKRSSEEAAGATYRRLENCVGRRPTGAPSRPRSRAT